MKTIINFKEKLRWIINSFFFPFLRFFFFLLILIWTFKSYETYYYYENIAIAKKHEEIECGKEKKTLSDLGEELLEKISMSLDDREALRARLAPAREPAG